MASYDIIGSIAIIKGEGKTKQQKLQQAEELLKKPSINTVVEKATEIKGRLRTFKTKYIAGEKTLETFHKENNCIFKLNVETCYFSPRQVNDRKDLAEKIKKSDKVLIMFRPNLKTTFLKQALSCAKKGTKIFYQGFSKESDLPKMIRQLEEEAIQNKKKLIIKDIKKSGDIAPYKFRYRIEILVA